ncbi:MAG: 23S rRNA (pseudouridine(1915)-N(3))-methyltransferase RlmH [Gammaproteobacteria bacterium]|nr:23S rRNA (pseudouridine(1915)-N(3))-methyltransferase RlmH [Gammaproteobacteria bacterium]
MHIHLVAVGTRMPAWITEGYREYARRLPPECSLRLVEIPPCKRRKTLSTERIREEEGRQLLAAIPEQSLVIALDVSGKPWSTQALAERLQDWLQGGRDIALLVGGADGLSAACLARADLHWSLSAHTLPHALVRVVIAEQVYRAWTLLSGHPYHRA